MTVEDKYYLEAEEILEKSTELRTKKLKNLNSFKKLKKLRDELIEKTSPKANKKSLFKKIFSFSDIILLLIFNVACLAYLSLFLNSYFSPETKLTMQFNRALNKFYSNVVSMWLNYNDFENVTNVDCAMPMPFILNNVLKPINDCTMCSDVNEIIRLKYITKEEFLDLYAYSAKPIIIEDATKKWNAMELLDFQYLKNLYNKSPSSKKEKDTCQFFPYKTKFKELNEVFSMKDDVLLPGSTNFKPWYIGWSNCNSYATKMIRKLYTKPYFLPDESQMSKTDWIFMGTPGYGANMHIDDVQYASWQAQVKGIKKWTFMPPPECFLKCKTLYATVYPGDVIVFDSNKWYHATEIIGDDISLTIGSEYD